MKIVLPLIGNFDAADYRTYLGTSLDSIIIFSFDTAQFNITKNDRDSLDVSGSCEIIFLNSIVANTNNLSQLDPSSIKDLNQYNIISQGQGFGKFTVAETGINLGFSYNGGIKFLSLSDNQNFDIAISGVLQIPNKLENNTISNSKELLNRMAWNLKGNSILAVGRAETQLTSFISDIFTNTISKQLNGTANNDTIVILKGVKEVNAGAGDDVISSGTNGSILRGGSGDDRIYGNAGTNKIYGDDGKDILIGGTGSDLIFGGKGDDILFGGGGVDQLRGDAGNDFLNGVGDNAQDILFGDLGRDTFFPWFKTRK
ncbi:calcium-binding protein [Nostoc piscinale]|uniref:calcium-binding protein n=1 Tax=Nostoc piscinale TaxID=224012 RepID=UPI0007858633|nr:calcium-binding protein [Nostoc piscinale]